VANGWYARELCCTVRASAAAEEDKQARRTLWYEAAHLPTRTRLTMPAAMVGRDTGNEDTSVMVGVCRWKHPARVRPLRYACGRFRLQCLTIMCAHFQMEVGAVCRTTGGCEVTRNYISGGLRWP
jgi:hypothetical protein